MPYYGKEGLTEEIAGLPHNCEKERFAGFPVEPRFACRTRRGAKILYNSL